MSYYGFLVEDCMRWVGNLVYEAGYIEIMDLGLYFGVWFVRYL